MKIYVVHKTIGGYAHEDADKSSVVGAFSDPKDAARCKIALGGEVTELNLDHMPYGATLMLKELGL